MKSKTTARFLALFLGFSGLQWFYLGKVGKGLLYLFTLGFFGIGWFFSIFTIGKQVDIYNVLHNGGYGNGNVNNNVNNNANNNMNNIVVNVAAPTATSEAQMKKPQDETKES